MDTHVKNINTRSMLIPLNIKEDFMKDAGILECFITIKTTK